MRTAFINQLVQEAKANEKIFLIVGDLGFNVVEPFQQLFPKRFLNIGIDEQNMVGVATGLALNGYNVYIYSIGNFPTLRCMEQIRYDVAYHHANVKIVSVGAGYAYGSLGASHHATEEMGMLRTIPNMVVCSPSDPYEARAITTISTHYEGPMYLRFGKAGEKNVHDNEVTLRIGDFCQFKESSTQNVLFVTGSIMDYAVYWVKEHHIDTAIYSVPFVKPMNEQQLLSIVQRHQHVVVLEEHQMSCGLGSALIEQISDLYSFGKIEKMPAIRRIAIRDIFLNVSGSQAYLRCKSGLVLSESMFSDK